MTNTLYRYIPNTKTILDKRTFDILTYLLEDPKTIVKENRNRITIKIKALKKTLIKIDYFDHSENHIEYIHFYIGSYRESIKYLAENHTKIRKLISEIADKLYLKNISEDDRKILNNVFFKDEKCPICESRSIFYQHYSDGILKIKCMSHNCYEINKYSDNTIYAYIKFFNKKQIVIPQVETMHEKILKIYEVKKTIDEYKYNEKYLIDILTENQKEN